MKGASATRGDHFPKIPSSCRQAIFPKNHLRGAPDAPWWWQGYIQAPGTSRPNVKSGEKTQKFWGNWFFWWFFDDFLMIFEVASLEFAFLDSVALKHHQYNKIIASHLWSGLEWVGWLSLTQKGTLVSCRIFTSAPDRLSMLSGSKTQKINLSQTS